MKKICVIVLVIIMVSIYCSVSFAGQGCCQYGSKTADGTKTNQSSCTGEKSDSGEQVQPAETDNN